MIKLSPRLAAVAALAGSGGSVIDVGTDHGYVPVYFAQKGLFSKIAASDLRPGPLESARASARKYGVFDKIAFILSDGLRVVPGPFDTVVIAGMGGETMAGILSDCPWAAGARLVLQPQSKFAEVGKCLGGLGFVCERAVLVEDKGKLYAAFSAARGEGGFDLLRALLDGRDPLLQKGLALEAARLDRALSGAERAGRRTYAYEALSTEKEAVLSALTEVRKW